MDKRAKADMPQHRITVKDVREVATAMLVLGLSLGIIIGMIIGSVLL